MKARYLGLAGLLTLVAGCTSLQKVDVLESDARSDSSAVQTRSAALYSNAVVVEDMDYMVESPLPILSTRVVPRKKDLPPAFGDEYLFVTNRDTPLIDVIKTFSSSTGIQVTTRDDVYVTNNAADGLTSTDGTGTLGLSSSAQIASEAWDESNLDVSSRIMIPSGARFSGSVEKFLDYLSSMLNISWDYLPDEGRTVLSRYVERGYRLFVPPSKNTGDDAAEIWANTAESIEGMLSSGGAVTVNQQAGLISVVDNRDVQTLVNQHIDRVNNSLRRSVFFEVEILSVAVDDSIDEAWDFSAVHSGAKSLVNIGGNGSALPGAASITASITDGPFANSKLIAQNLSEKGEVTLSMSRIMRSINNQSATFSSTERIPVLASYTPPTVSGDTVVAGGANLTNVDVGFSMTLTPSIMDDGQNMVVRIELETSNIKDITEIPLSDNGQTLQSAQTMSRQFEEVFPMLSGQTMIVSGLYDRANSFNQKTTNNGFLSWLFSKRSDSASRQYYVVLLTPKVSTASL